MHSILVTGGAGYIGCHTVRLLAESGYHSISFDNLSQGHREALLGEPLVVGDLSDEAALESLFGEHPIDAVMHFAARASVDESVKNVTDALIATGMWNSTLFVWTTDNGSPIGVGGSNHPLRGGKVSGPR